MGGLIELDALDTLKRKAHAYESQAGADLPPLPGEPAPIDPAAEWEMTLSVLVAALSPALPYIPTVYTPDAIKALSAAIVPVADKYGLSVGGADVRAGNRPAVGGRAAGAGHGGRA
ncbi:hypothetical protein OJJOAM_000234 [Cupriavidus sp. H18C1]|uniref:hypothetical protein n=1 Tax=Cupriavidus sp. H18C1 TaxID=3241601 RepID=UPI003BB854E9